MIENNPVWPLLISGHVIAIIDGGKVIFIMTSSNGDFFSALLSFCVGNSPVTGEFPEQRPATRSFDVLFDLCLNTRLSKHHENGDLRRHCTHYDVTIMLNSQRDGDFTIDDIMNIP